jgi:hypothetical protein
MAWFTRDARLHEFAVRKTSELLKREGYNNKIVNAEGYDILLEDGRKIEVKHDTFIYTSGNLACEWWSDKENKKQGWIRYSDADILVYMYDFDNAYVLNMKRLKEYVELNKDRLPSKPPYRGKSTSKAEVKLVPISDVSQFRIKEFENIFTKYAILPQK